ncbi:MULTISPECIES: MerR family transcriptional regulator [Paenibacillus]|uniref:MerR family transcriptional regulator n=1 Tax=Paenibacillus alvei TaxID=44250 RepID=A0ABT4E5Y6_PAEAL|nr:MULTISPECIES: MerR family transcriptional regulator [Paenibacillus]EPY14824.1 MerR family transcriptional regulator [Paenibacillus alvei A6-6i-x]MCY9527883.1 MerR family transcriptional regulator [Paenibacillus alvei]SDF36583.1 DNA-binding transcriptional regulator, MerR family [Paenibacillus sp. cl6col]
MEELQYTVGQLAELCGTTVRTIQYYDNIGLLASQRYGGSNKRTYRERDLVKLQQILFYKSLGFNLKEIQEQCLAYEDKGDLKRILQRQSSLLFTKEMEFRSDRSFIDAMVSCMENSDSINVETIMKLTLNKRKHLLLDYIDMNLPTEAKAIFELNIINDQAAIQVYWQWKGLTLEAYMLMINGIHPVSDAGYSLGKRWDSFVRYATKEKQEMREAYRISYEEKEHWPEEDRFLTEYCEHFIEEAHRHFLGSGERKNEEEK